MRYLSTAAILLVAIAGFGLQGQTIDLRANVPFEFRMGHAVMPAGEYRVQHDRGVVLLHGQNGSRKVMNIGTIPAQLSALPQQSSLQFHRYGSTYFLAKVWTRASATGRALPKSPEEKEFARASTPVELASIPLRRK